MLLSNEFWRILFAVSFLAGAKLVAQILELGESQLHGKKDQPEAWTVLGRAPIDDIIEIVPEKKLSVKIKEDIKSPIFDLSSFTF